MNYLLYILVALLPFVITDNLWDYSDLPKTLFIRNGVILLAVVFFWTQKFKDIRISQVLIAYMVFLLWAGLSIFWAINKYEALVVFTWWSVAGLFLFLVQNMNINKTAIFLILIFTAWIVALIGLGQHFFHLDWVLQSSNSASTFANSNLAGAYVLMAMPLGVALMVTLYQRKSWVSFGIFAVVMTTIGGYLYVADFKTALVVILIIGTYYLVKHLRRIKYVVIVIVLIGLFVVFYLKADFFYNNNSFRSRIKIWRNTAEIIKQHPVIGVGVGNFKVHYDKYADLRMNTNDTHNDYLQLLSELGIVGVYLAFLVLVYAYRAAFKKRDLYSTALKAGLWVVLIVAMFNFPMQKAALPFISALYMGMLKV